MIPSRHAKTAQRGAAVVALALCAIPATAASAAEHGNGTRGAFTLAVYGDAPYGTFQGDTAEFDATPAFIDSINADPDVSTVMHVGDIHSGKQYCTQAYDQSIADLWTRFADPLVYTPGDNEWTDCHKAGEGGGAYNPATGQIDYVLDPVTAEPVDYASGNPVANLALIRSIFFASRATPSAAAPCASCPRRRCPTALIRRRAVRRERDVGAARDPVRDDQRARWLEQRRRPVVRGANGLTGAAGGGDAANGADLRWLDAAFALAHADDAAGVVVVTQADMWDLDGKTPAHLTNYEPIVSSLASHTTAFGKPVLLFNGDSHTYRSDNPLMPGGAVHRRRRCVQLRRVEQPPVLRGAELSPHRGARQHVPARVAETDRSARGTQPHLRNGVRPVQLDPNAAELTDTDVRRVRQCRPAYGPIRTRDREKP